jgi:hypothetical protein
VPETSYAPIPSIQRIRTLFVEGGYGVGALFPTFLESRVFAHERLCPVWMYAIEDESRIG